jgi:acyl-[acyl carrier protein]--UDP-N-acetylglucosamine O-acyltransferase
VVVHQFANMEQENHIVKNVVVLEFANMEQENHIVKNVVVLHYVKVSGAKQSVILNMKVIVLLVL